MRRACIAAVLLVAGMTRATAQAAGTNVELVLTTSLVGGFVPTSVSGASYVDPYAVLTSTRDSSSSISSSPLA